MPMRTRHVVPRQSQSHLNIGIFLVIRQTLGVLPEQNRALAAGRLLEGFEPWKRLKCADIRMEQPREGAAAAETATVKFTEDAFLPRYRPYRD